MPDRTVSHLAITGSVRMYQAISFYPREPESSALLEEFQVRCRLAFTRLDTLTEGSPAESMLGLPQSPQINQNPVAVPLPGELC